MKRCLAATMLALTMLTAAPAQACRGVWICPDEMQELPTQGPAWGAVKAMADRPRMAPRLADQNDNADVQTLALALVYGRTGELRYRTAVIEQVRAAIGSERAGNILGLGRNLPGYVIAADIVGLPPDLDEAFRTWLAEALDQPLQGATLRTIHERRPNNWGTHAGAARLAIARYLGDDAEVERIAMIFRAWVGDRSVAHRFRFGEPSWQDDPAAPAGINRAGASRDGKPLDGVLPDDQRRCCDHFTWPPPHENYVYEALQGALAQAQMLARAGYGDVWNWQDKAVLRAYRWLYEVAGYAAAGDDSWQPYLVNHVYGTHFSAPSPSRPGKNIGFTDWTHDTPIETSSTR